MTIGRDLETKRPGAGQASLPNPTEEQSSTREISSAASDALVSTTPILGSVPSASAENSLQASPLFKMLTTLENPPLAVALDLDLTAVTIHGFHTKQFISQMVLNFMRILQQRRQMSYYPATHRGMATVAPFYVDVQVRCEEDKIASSAELINYRTYRVVENLKNELNQPAAAVSTADDLVFSIMEKEKEAILGSGFVKLALYEKALYEKSTTGEKFELEDFKKEHPGLRVTPLRFIQNKNNQLLSIAKHLIEVNKDNLKNNPEMKIELLVLDDQMDILIDALHYERNTRWHREKELRYRLWPDCIKLTVLCAINYPLYDMHRNKNDFLNMHLAAHGKRHFRPISPGKPKTPASPLFFETYVFQPFFVEVTLNEKEEWQYGDIITHDFLEKELQAVLKTSSVEVKSHESPAPVANETKNIVDSMVTTEATVKDNEPKKEAEMAPVPAEVKAPAAEETTRIVVEAKAPAAESTRIAEGARVETASLGDTLEMERFTRRNRFFKKVKEKVSLLDLAVLSFLELDYWKQLATMTGKEMKASDNESNQITCIVNIVNTLTLILKNGRGLAKPLSTNLPNEERTYRQICTELLDYHKGDKMKDVMEGYKFEERDNSSSDYDFRYVEVNRPR